MYAAPTYPFIDETAPVSVPPALTLVRQEDAPPVEAPRTTIEVPIALLRALLPFASKDPTRYNLCGIHVDEHGFTATDGHVLCHIPSAGIPAAWHKVTLSRADVEAIIRASPKKHGGWYAYLDASDRTGMVGGGIKVPLTSVDGTFPDYKQVIPTHTRRERCAWNVQLLARAELVASLSPDRCDIDKRGGPLTLEACEELGPARFSTACGAIVVVMPMRL
jgi:hypothetical protein